MLRGERLLQFLKVLQGVKMLQEPRRLRPRVRLQPHLAPAPPPCRAPNPRSGAGLVPCPPTPGGVVLPPQGSCSSPRGRERPGCRQEPVARLG